MNEPRPIPRIPEFDVQAIMGLLPESGIVIVEGFVNDDELPALNDEFDALLEEPESSWIEHRDYSLGVGRLMSNAEIPDRYKQTNRVFRDPRMNQLLEAYHPQSELECNKKLWAVKDVVGSNHIAQDLHFDIAHTLKFFLYLMDTGEGNGAFKCIPGSQVQTAEMREEYKGRLNYQNRQLSRVPSRTAEAVSAVGKAGDLIIFDTDTLHMAGQCTSGERRVMRAQSSPVPYSYPKSAQTEQEQSGKVAKLFKKIRSKW